MVQKKLLLQCMMDDDFQKIIETDSVLEALQAKKYNRSSEFFEYCFLNDGLIKLCGLPVKKLTPKKWSLLWILQNQFTIDAKKVTKKDIDEFLYIMTTDIKSIQEVIYSVDFCTKNNINYEEAQSEILTLIQINFKPLTMLPASSIGVADEPFYGMTWLIHIGTVVSRMAGVPAIQVINDFSLNSCFYFMIEELKEKGAKIMVQTEDEINKAIFERTYELANEYYLKVYGKEE